MQTQYGNDPIPDCDHSTCHHPAFDSEYMNQIRREFRSLSIPKRQMLFETTTQRILLHFDNCSSSQYPFEIHCFLPWNGSLRSVCNQFYCRTLKIPYQMLESHHKYIWKSSQFSASRRLLPSPTDTVHSSKHFHPNRLDKVYQCYLPAIINSFNILPIDASSYLDDDSHCLPQHHHLDIKSLYHHSPRSKQGTHPQMAMYPKLKTNPIASGPHRRGKNKKMCGHRRRGGLKKNTPRASASQDERRRRDFAKYMRGKKRQDLETRDSKTTTTANSKNVTRKLESRDREHSGSEQEEEDKDVEPKLLLGILRNGFPSKTAEDATKRTKKKANEPKHSEKNKDELAPLNRFMKNIRSISDRVAGITNEFHQIQVAEYESMRDNLFLQKIMSEADVDPTDATVDEPDHWKKVETMFEVMDHKESSARGKQHIERALKSLHSPDLRQILKQVRDSLTLLHDTVDALSSDPAHPTAGAVVYDDELKALMDLDRFISPALKQQHLAVPGGDGLNPPKRVRSAVNMKSKASVLIESKDAVLRSLDQTISLRNTAADALSSLKETATPFPDEKRQNEDGEELLIGINHRATVIYDSHPPEHMAARSENRRSSLMNAGILEDDLSDSSDVVQPEKFVEDMLLSKIEDLSQQRNEWRSKHEELASQHRRMSVQHSEMVKALKNSDVLNGNERFSSLIEHQQSMGDRSTMSTHDVAIQTMEMASDDSLPHFHRIRSEVVKDRKDKDHGRQSMADAVAHVDRDLEVEMTDEDVIYIPKEETDKHLVSTGMHFGGLTLSYKSDARRFSVIGNIENIQDIDPSDDDKAIDSGLDQSKLASFVGVLGVLKSLRMDALQPQPTNNGNGRRRRLSLFAPP